MDGTVGLAWLPNYRLSKAAKTEHELKLLVVGPLNSGRHCLLKTLFQLERLEELEGGWLIGQREEGGVRLKIVALVREPQEVSGDEPVQVCLWLNPTPKYAPVILAHRLVIPLLGKADCLLPSEIERQKRQLCGWLSPNLSPWKQPHDQPWFQTELEQIEVAPFDFDV